MIGPTRRSKLRRRRSGDECEMYFPLECHQSAKVRTAVVKRVGARFVLALVPIVQWEILQNSSCVCAAVYEILTALEPALPDEEIQKHVRSTQYQLRVFKDVDCFMSLRRRYLDKAVTFFFRNGTIQRCKGNAGCCLFQNARIRDLQWQRLIFYRL